MSVAEIQTKLRLSSDEQEALGLLTRDSSVPYADYIERLADAAPPAGDLARRVKLADLHANLSRRPLSGRPELEARYRAALERLAD